MGDVDPSVFFLGRLPPGNPDSYLAESQPADLEWQYWGEVSPAEFIDPSKCPLVSMAPMLDILSGVFGETPEKAAALIDERRGAFATILRHSWLLDDFMNDEFRDRLYRARALHGFTLSERLEWSACSAMCTILTNKWRAARRWFQPSESLSALWKREVEGLVVKIGAAELRWVGP